MNPHAIINHIVGWLRAYAQKAGVNGFVIGISGGIDSAVASVLCAKTGLDLCCLEMPIHQDSSQMMRGKRHIKHLESNYSHVSSREIDLTETYNRMVRSLPRATNSDTENLALANTRARLRMTTLYYIAGIHGLLVVGTGNKIEDFGVGFFTKYGDGGVDLSPIADLTKSEIYKLGEALGIDPEILRAPPTDGLWGDDRSDEDQLGASYPELEWAMAFSGNENQLDNRQSEILAIFRKLHRQNQHKMLPIPTCLIPDKLR